MVDAFIRLKSPFAIFFLKKTAFFFVTLLVALSIIFIVPRMMPSSPVDMMVARVGLGGSYSSMGSTTGGAAGSAGSSALELMRKIYTEKFGLNESLPVQYVHFWRRFLTMDYGISYWRYPRTVLELVILALPWTLVLVIPVQVFSFFAGNWLGSRSAYYGGKLDKIVYIVGVYLYQSPYYWFSLLLVFTLGVNLKWFPIYGAYSVKWAYPVLSPGWVLDATWHYALPFLSLVGSAIGGQSVAMRAMTLYELGANYQEYGRQLGFREEKLRKYAQRNAILPIFTWIPLDLSSLIGQTLLVEVVFGYPGLGSLMFNGVLNMDYPLIEATFIVTILIVLLGNFICDLLYGRLDPRIASGYIGGK